MAASKNDDGSGCVVLIIIACAALGIGGLTSTAWGFLSAAVMFLILLLLAKS